jgi:hypothetical protein
MNPQARAAVMLELARKMRERGSWCGVDHIQSGLFLLQELAGLPLGFDFELSGRGPFSQDLESEIERLEADGLLHLVHQPPFEASIEVSPAGAEIAQASGAASEHGRSLEFVAEKVDALGVADLVYLSTALYITGRHPGLGAKERAEELSSLKQSLGLDEALRIVEEIDALRRET